MVMAGAGAKEGRKEFLEPEEEEERSVVRFGPVRGEGAEQPAATYEKGFEFGSA